MAVKIGFCGAAQTVTGSRHLLTLDKATILVDCGLFQGSRELRQRNWQEFPIPPHELDAVVITHAHLDHIGWLPRLVAEGYRGPIYATPATIALSRLSLPDSARLQEEDARHHAKHGSSHHPPLPLYTEPEAFEALKQFEPVRYGVTQNLPGGASFTFSPAGHILGSAFADIQLPNGRSLLMSGDLGRYNTPIIQDPAVVESADYLTIESTYGDRVHPSEDVQAKLSQILRDAMQNGSSVIVPSFAIGRTQELLYYIRRLQNAGELPRIPIFIDSPMATSATHIYANAKEEFDEDMQLSVEQGKSELEPEGVTYIRDREASKALNRQPGPLVIIAGSGMANGGRVQHHLLHRLSDPKTVVLFTGYQAEGTLGRRILDGAPEVSIFGQELEVRAQVNKLNALSAHADSNEIMTWLKDFKRAPKQTFIVHGEPPAQQALLARIQKELGWNAVIPHPAEEFELD